jgi:hypothetical protein
MLCTNFSLIPSLQHARTLKYAEKIREFEVGFPDFMHVIDILLLYVTLFPVDKNK